MLHKSTTVSSNDSININHRKISLTGTDNYNSKLSKVIQFDEKITQFFNISENLQENHKKTYFRQIYSGALRVNFK